MQHISIILPSLNPDNKMSALVQSLLAHPFLDIILINDGSDAKHLAPFEKAAQHPQCTVLTHEVNRGKGQALKTGFSYVLQHRPNCRGVVTIDGDGQHTVEDIALCAATLLEKKNTVVLGMRDFNAPDVPARSRFGNKLTAVLFRMLFGLSLHDTQTGLRAIPFSLLPALCEVQGQRFEYETNMLLYFKRARIPLFEVPISTVYLEENKTSHFSPIKDSLRIYAVILRFFLSSISASLIDIGLFTVLNLILGSFVARGVRLLCATAIARVTSALFNYTVNHKLVFQSDAPPKKTLLRYGLLCVAQMLVSYGLVFLLSRAFSAVAGLDTVIKIVVDTILFFISFRIQQGWVFAQSSSEKNTPAS